MEIPKYVDAMIVRRRRLAEELNTVDVKLSDWMEKKGMDLTTLSDYVRTGCIMYCEPAGAEKAVREAIEEYEE